MNVHPLRPEPPKPQRSISLTGLIITGTLGIIFLGFLAADVYCSFRFPLRARDVQMALAPFVLTPGLLFGFAIVALISNART